MFDNRQFITSLVNSGDYEIDWANPITQGLRVFFHDGRNLVNGTLCTPSSAAVGGAWKVDAYGKYWAVTGDTEYWEVPMTGMLRNSGASSTDLYIGNDRAKFTVLAFAQTSSGGAGYNSVVSHTEAGYAGGWYLSSRVYASGGLLGCTQGGAGYVTSNLNPSTSKPQVFGCAYGASNADFICDGVLNTGVSNIASFYCTPNRIRIGARNNHNGDGEGMTSGDKLYWAMIWSRRLSVGELESINDNPMQIIKPRFGRILKFASAGTTTLSPPLLTSTPTIYAPSIALSLALSAPLIDSSPTIYAPSLTESTTLSAPLLDSSASIYSPGISLSLGLAAPLVTSGPTLYEPSISSQLSLSAPILSSESTVYAPSLSSLLTVTATLLSSEPTIYSPSISSTLQISAPAIDSSPTIHAPSIGLALSVTAPRLESSATIYAPEIISGFVISAPLLGSSASIYAPSISSSLAITAPLVDSSAIIYAPSIAEGTTLSAPLLDSSASLFAPSVSLSLQITAPLLTSTPTIYGPSVSYPVELSAPLLSSSATIYAPIVSFGGAVDAAYRTLSVKWKSRTLSIFNGEI